MGDFVGVDPRQLRKLVDRLDALEHALQQGAQTIRHNYGDWGSDLDFSPVVQQSHAVADDAHMMHRRSDLARELERDGGPHLYGANSNMLSIPWDKKDLDSKAPAEARAEAKRLKQALDHPDAAGSRDDITAIAGSLTDHQNDAHYMAAFAAAGGVADAARLARVLHHMDGTHNGKTLADTAPIPKAAPQPSPLLENGLSNAYAKSHPGSEITPESSTKLLASYSAAVQNILSMQHQGKIPNNPAYLRSLTHPPHDDMWSVGMLFKYGPKGNKWDPSTLKAVSGSMLDWRSKQQMRPSFSQHRNLQTGYITNHFSNADNAWYSSLGIAPPSTDTTGVADVDLNAIRANDPALAVLSRLGENEDASRDLLSGDGKNGSSDADAKRHAAQLLDYRWQTPGLHPVDDSDPIRKVLTLAATDRSPEHHDQSGRAAGNILDAAEKENDTFTKRGHGDQQAYPIYPQGTAIGLAGVTGSWADDLGANTYHDHGSTVHGLAPDHTLMSNPEQLSKVMQLFARKDPKAAAMFDTTMHKKVTDTMTTHGSDRQIRFMGNLAGQFNKAKNDLKYTDAQKLDEMHNRDLLLLNTAGVLFGFADYPESMNKTTTIAKMTDKGLTYSKNMVLAGRTLVAPQSSTFSTNNADIQEHLNADMDPANRDKYSMAIVQGMIRSGELPQPPDSSNWFNGSTQTIDPRAYKANGFQEQMKLPAVDHKLNQFNAGFTNGNQGR